MTRVYPLWTSLTRDQIIALVEEALEDGVAIDIVITNALYPDGVPKRWADWSEDAKDIHLEAIELHCQRRKTFLSEPVLVDSHSETGRRHRPRHHITIERGWEVVRASMKAEPASVRLTWPDMAARLGVQPRSAEHLLKGKLGFRFSGGGCYGKRMLDRGPCVECGKLHPANDFTEDNHGPCCAAKRAA